MKRRLFLKGLLGASAVAPVVAKAVTETKGGFLVPKGTTTSFEGYYGKATKPTGIPIMVELLDKDEVVLGYKSARNTDQICTIPVRVPGTVWRVRATLINTPELQSDLKTSTAKVKVGDFVTIDTTVHGGTLVELS